jgi:hypothetical protein
MRSLRQSAPVPWTPDPANAIEVGHEKLHSTKFSHRNQNLLKQEYQYICLMHQWVLGVKHSLAFDKKWQQI